MDYMHFVRFHNIFSKKNYGTNRYTIRDTDCSLDTVAASGEDYSILWQQYIALLAAKVEKNQ